MVRQAQDERNQLATVRPEPVAGLIQSFLNLRLMCAPASRKLAKPIKM
jgi:hypothetical protein